MDDKKTVRIGATGALLIIAIIVIAIMCMYISKLSKEKASAEARVVELESQVNSLNGRVSTLNQTIAELQGKLKIISDTINSVNTTSENTEGNNVSKLIVGKWRVDRVTDSNGKEISLNTVFGSGIAISNVMEFMENGDHSYSIGITAGGGYGKYTMEGNALSYSVPTDTRDVYTWHNAEYDVENDTIVEEQEALGEKQIIYYSRVK